MASGQIPNARVAVLNADGTLSLPWRLYLTGLSGGGTDLTALEAELAAVAADVSMAEAQASQAATSAAQAIATAASVQESTLVALGQIGGVRSDLTAFEASVQSTLSAATIAAFVALGRH